jgi:vacuolar iron transporter family protein
MKVHHSEIHYSQRAGWLRAAVLGANDGLVSTASLLVGLAAAHTQAWEMMVAGFAGLVAGAMSMAAGEYVSVSSQADAQKADLEKEREELALNRKYELEELTQIYVQRGVQRELAQQVSQQLMEHDALAAHAREELGIFDLQKAKPLQAALASATTFVIGAGLPIITLSVLPHPQIGLWIFLSTSAFLFLLGAVAAQLGGASRIKGALRVGFWGMGAMIVTGLVGSLMSLS